MYRIKIIYFKIKTKKLFLFFAILGSIPGCTGFTKNLPQVIFRGQTEDEAFGYVMYLIKKISWYKENGYKIWLPEHEEFEKLRKNHDAISTINVDYLKKIFSSQAYNASAFAESLKVICKARGRVNRALQKLAVLEKNWGFHLKPKYEITLTLYGMGGSYDPDRGKIIMLAVPGWVIKVERKARTIVHEIVHIGIEENIVKKYKLGHWQKERVVDLICSLYLKDLLPNYKPSHLNEKYGDRRIDAFVNEKTTL